MDSNLTKLRNTRSKMVDKIAPVPLFDSITVFLWLFYEVADSTDDKQSPK